MRCLAEDRAIVLFNISDIRSDAFLITWDDIRCIQLPLMTSALIEDFVIRFFKAINENDPTRGRYARQDINRILERLWDCAAAPVLNELNFKETWLRVCWVTTGWLSLLPIHAVGYHNSNPPRMVLDRVISSYGHSLKSLLYARERMRKQSQPDAAILFAMPTTPGSSTLPFVKTEVEAIKSLFSNTSIPTTIAQNVKRTEALSNFSKHSIVHFSCH